MKLFACVHVVVVYDAGGVKAHLRKVVVQLEPMKRRIQELQKHGSVSHHMIPLLSVCVCGVCTCLREVEKLALVQVRWVVWR